MASIAWPASLPNIVYPKADSGYQRQADSGVLRSQMDAGPPKMRARFSAVVVPVTITMEMTSAQVSDLETFYWTTTGRVNRWNWTDQLTGQSREYRFTDAPQYMPLAANWWRVQLKLEIMP